MVQHHLSTPLRSSCLPTCLLISFGFVPYTLISFSAGQLECWNANQVTFSDAFTALVGVGIALSPNLPVAALFDSKPKQMIRFTFLHLDIFPFSTLQRVDLPTRLLTSSTQPIFPQVLIHKLHAATNCNRSIRVVYRSAPMADECIVCLGSLVDHHPDSSSSRATSSPHLDGDALEAKQTRSHDENESNDRLIAFLPSCGHYLHDECLKSWTERANSCPICRKSFNTVDLWTTVGGKFCSNINLKWRVAFMI